MKIIKRVAAIVLAIFMLMAWCPLFPVNEAKADADCTFWIDGNETEYRTLEINRADCGFMPIDIPLRYPKPGNGASCTFDAKKIYHILVKPDSGHPIYLNFADSNYLRDTFTGIKTFKMKYRAYFVNDTVTTNMFHHNSTVGGLKELEIFEVHEPTKYIGDYAFSMCPKLRSVRIPGVVNIGKGAFANSGATDGIVNGFSGAKLICDYAFQGCDKLTNITLPSAETISWGAFEQCDSLETVNFSSATIIKDYGFYNCIALKNINVPKVERIDWNGFLNCTSLTQISLPSASFIGIDAFKDCTSLESVYLPSQVTLDRGAFYNCTSLDTLILGHDVPNVLNDNIFDGCPDVRTVYVPESAISAYDPDGDGKWRGWTISSLSNECYMFSFSFDGLSAPAIGVFDGHEISVTVPYGTDITELTPSISISNGATVSPESGTEQDFTTSRLLYTVTAKNPVFKKFYYVTVTVAKNPDNYIETFDFDGLNPKVVGTIEADNTINLTVPYDTDITNLAPTITISQAATVTPNSGVVQDFTAPMTYTVEADNGDTRMYTVQVNITPNNKNEIESFVFNDLEPNIIGIVDDSNNTVSITVPYGTDITNLTPTIAISGDATISPQSGEAQDFTNPVTYKVTAQNGDEQDYVVTTQVSVFPSIAANDITWIAECAIDEDDVLRESGATSNVPVKVADWGGLDNQSPQVGSYQIKLSADNDGHTTEKIITVTVVAHVGNGAYNITAKHSGNYTSSLEDMTRTLTINSGITGFKYFEVDITKLTGHSGEETIVFTHYRNGKMIGVFASPDDYDTKTKAIAGFNVAPGDKIKVYIVDKLTSSSNENPTIL